MKKNNNSIFPINKTQCSGCGACAVKCPTRAISVQEDDSGFHYPALTGACTQCGLCVKTCPWQTTIPKRNALEVCEAAHNTPEVLCRSSSGGVFSALAQHTLNNNGVVFGVCWEHNTPRAVFDYTENIDGLWKFCQSKYVEAELRDAYAHVRDFLDTDRFVLFTGTPCQIAGLYRALGKTYPKLTTMEIICHGVPSSLLLQKYIKTIEDKYKSTVTQIQMRSKQFPWRGCCGVIINFSDGQIIREPFTENLYTQLFCKVFSSLRPSCIQCAFAGTERVADITTGDFWGLWNFKPHCDQQHGISCVLIQAPHLSEILDDFMTLTPSTIENVFASNRQPYPPINRKNNFYKDLQRLDLELLLKKYTTPPKPKKLNFFQKVYYKFLYEIKKRIAK